MQLIDTHCHIHEDGYGLDATAVIKRAAEAGVSKLLCVGTSVSSSAQAVQFAARHPASCRASIGLHPHHASEGQDTLKNLAALVRQPGVVAIGECGLDYYYLHSSKPAQRRALQFQIELALEHDLPLIFHVRDAFTDFFALYDGYKHATASLRGVVHSFTAGRRELEQVLERGLYVGLNGIMTFTKDAEQLAAAAQVPLDRILLETDAPYLTPVPYRGKVNESKYVVATAQFLAELRGETLEKLAHASTANATELFKL